MRRDIFVARGPPKSLGIVAPVSLALVLVTFGAPASAQVPIPKKELVFFAFG